MIKSKVIILHSKSGNDGEIKLAPFESINQEGLYFATRDSNAPDSCALFQKLDADEPKPLLENLEVLLPVKYTQQ